ncbi:MAG: LamG-like jellyroll fold domain-containing protein, partial [Pirellulales bacterium]
MKWVRSSVVAGACLLGCLSQNASAVNLLYDFEGDGGTSVTDKLTSDGAQNGAIYNNVDPTDSFNPHFGNQSAFFDNPPPLVTGAYSTIEIPDSTFAAGSSVTMAGWVNQDIINTELRRFRVFSSFSGTSAVPNNIMMLDAGNAATSSSVRGIVGGIQFSGSLPALASGYHHYAMTIDGSVVGNGAVKIYVDGAPVTTSATGTLGLYSNAVNLRIGEDINNYPQQNSANEQIVGNVDDMFVLGRALSAGDISAIYAAGVGAPVSSVVTPGVGEKAIYYDFEGGPTVTDQFASDGSQNGIVHELATIDGTPANAKVGGASANFQNPQPASTPGSEIFSQINAGPVGALGPNFTLSAVVNPYSTGQISNGVARIFSSYQGTGSTAGQLILDFNPSTATGIRLYLPSNNNAATLTVAGPGKPDLDPGTTQTITVVYETGATNDTVKLYLDGALIGSKTDLPPGTVQTLGANDLRIGEDRGGYRGAYANENYTGSMDDLMILSRALTPEQVAFLSTNGASALLATLVTPGDYSGNGVIDAADYTVWRDSFGKTGTGLAADGNGDNVVNDADYLIWKQNFGSGGSGSVGDATAAPEPSALVLLAIGGCLAIGRRNSR